MIRTVTGNWSKQQVKFALSHEHLSLDLRKIRKDQDSILNDLTLQTQELEVLRKQGFNLVVDLSNQNMGRNIHHLVKLSQKTGLKIVAATGYYLAQYHSSDFIKRSVTNIASEFIKDITYGINDSNIKAGVIGELGSSSQRIFPSEHKVLLAAIIAQKETGCPIFTHVDFGNHALEQVKILLQAGGNANKIVIGHMDLVSDRSVLIQILKTGVSIAFDTIGKNHNKPDALRCKMLIYLIKLGYENQIVLSLDISRRSYLKQYGGHGYGHIMNKFYPMLQPDITPKVWQKLISTNIAKILDF